MEPFFLESADSQIFCLYHAPKQTVTHALLIVPPFAEEMNKSRRMLALLQQALSRNGCASLLFDFFGTGDSASDFADARSAIWQQNLLDASAELTRRSGLPRMALLSVRAGALLAASVYPQLASQIQTLLLWHPVVRGDAFMTQFLRLRLAADMMQEAGEKATTTQLRNTLLEQGVLEIAGYGLSQDIHGFFEQADLAATRFHHPVHWFELGGQTHKPLSPASSKVLEAWRGTGVTVTAESVAGDAFWSTQEISTSPALIDATVAKVVTDVA